MLAEQPTKAPSRRGYQRLDLDECTEPGEVGRVVRREPAQAVGLHRGDDVGVVDLLAADGDRAQEHQQIGRDRRPVLGDPELRLEADDVRDQGRGGQWRRVGLGPLQGREVLARDLPAQPQLDAGLAKGVELSEGRPVKRRGCDRRVDQDIRVHEDRIRRRGRCRHRCPRDGT
jgi:hypothetical protein